MLNDSQLTELCKALGWQGGTFHQVLATVQSLAKFQNATIDAYRGTIPGWNKHMQFNAVRDNPFDVDDPKPLYILRE
jgi:hypothetical protein